VGNILKNVSQTWRHGTDAGYGARKYKGPANFSTEYSSTKKGKTTFDPSIRRMQDETYGRLGEGISRYLADTDVLRGRYTGNQSAYKDARLNPLREQMALRRGEMQRSIGRRNMTGSSFGDQAITSFDMDSQRALGDAAALAENEDLQALSGLDMNRLNAIYGANEQGRGIYGDRLSMELAGLDLGRQQVEQLRGSHEDLMNRRMMMLELIRKGHDSANEQARAWTYGAMGMGQGSYSNQTQRMNVTGGGGGGSLGG
jgi:hypothetical protein